MLYDSDKKQYQSWLTDATLQDLIAAHLYAVKVDDNMDISDIKIGENIRGVHKLEWKTKKRRNIEKKNGKTQKLSEGGHVGGLQSPS